MRIFIYLSKTFNIGQTIYIGHTAGHHISTLPETAAVIVESSSFYLGMNYYYYYVVPSVYCWQNASFKDLR